MILSSAFRQPEVYDAATYALMVAVVVAFAGVSLFQVMIPAKIGDPRWRAAYVHLRNGLYANVWFDRWVGALRVRGARKA
jgi:NAD(P)H-quinone oxidoreductase subunit 5